MDHCRREVIASMPLMAVCAVALHLGSCRGPDPSPAGSEEARSSGVSDAVSAARRAAGRLPLEVCPTDWGDEEVLCGSLEVPENRTLEGGRTIALHVVVVPALSTDVESDPIFDMDGGPGLPSTAAAEWYARETPFRRRRDVVLVDLRGMGGSNPLHCDMVGDPTVLQNHLQEMYPPERVEACRQELETRADLTQYTTSNAMADLDAVRSWLGYERINILAISYGARAAYVYARAHPDRVRTMVLMGPADLDAKVPLHHAEWAERAFVQLCVDCRSEPACNAAFPDLEAKLRELVDRLRLRPATVTYQHPELAAPATVTIRADIFVESLRTALYDVSSRSAVPWIVGRAYEGDFGPFLDRAIPRHLQAPPYLAEGAYLSITGAEDVPFIRDEEIAKLTAGTLLGDYRIVQQRRAARLWPRGSLPPDFFSRVALDVPVLILQGGRDPVVAGGKAVASYRNGREVVVPHGAHLFDGLSNMECLDGLVDAFLRSADAGALDATCVSEMLPPPFEVAADTRD